MFVPKERRRLLLDASLFAGGVAHDSEVPQFSCLFLYAGTLLNRESQYSIQWFSFACSDIAISTNELYISLNDFWVSSNVYCFSLEEILSCSAVCRDGRMMTKLSNDD